MEIIKNKNFSMKIDILIFNKYSKELFLIIFLLDKIYQFVVGRNSAFDYVSSKM